MQNTGAAGRLSKEEGTGDIEHDDFGPTINKKFLNLQDFLNQLVRIAGTHVLAMGGEIQDVRSAEMFVSQNGGLHRVKSVRRDLEGRIVIAL